MIVSVQEVYVPGPFFAESGIKNAIRIFTPGIEYFYPELLTRRQVSE
jgi:hypothetical protein